GPAQSPTCFAQRHGLPDQPRFCACCRRILPMLWLCDRLSVQLKSQFRMAGSQNIGVEILMTSDTAVRPDIQISQVPHAGGYAHRVGPIGTCMTAKPRGCCVMAALT